MQFTIHTGETVTGDRLENAINSVADWYAAEEVCRSYTDLNA